MFSVIFSCREVLTAAIMSCIFYKGKRKWRNWYTRYLEVVVGEIPWGFKSPLSHRFFLMKWVAIGLLRVYQWCISPLIGSACRFYPSCSEYSVQAFSKHGFFYGFWLMIKRIVKCQPYHPGGYDPVP